MVHNPSLIKSSRRALPDDDVCPLPMSKQREKSNKSSSTPRRDLGGRYRSLLRRAPVASCYCIGGIAGAVWFVFDPGTAAFAALEPQRVADSGQLWPLLTYVFIPLKLIPHFVTMVVLLLMAWHVEPRLSLPGAILLAVGSALVGGVAYLVSSSTALFSGGAFILSGYAAAFFVWFYRNRDALPAGFRVGWAMPPIALINSITLGPALAVASLFAFVVGIVSGLTAERVSS